MNEVELMTIDLGQQGSTFINTTTEYVGKWRLIHTLADTVFAILDDSVRKGDTLGSTVFRTGVVYGGQITRIKLVSGAIIAYE